MARLAEIGVGCLSGIWLREGKPFVWRAACGAALVLYSTIVTFQTFSLFGCVYAVCFVGMEENQKHHIYYDWAGAAICLEGIAIRLGRLVNRTSTLRPPLFRKGGFDVHLR
ncbi:hypothetical protein [Domibacillus robiginosus]|uniref:hypothetical protein n=1 Tax=Domibacillus robiginosus TaxID=1071054 RepID=UPI00067CD9F2|nr:hypothetical protein [Domibacillus robiginosus]